MADALTTEIARMRRNYTHMANIPEGHVVVSMVVHKDTVFVATDKGVYFLANGLLHPVMFICLPEKP